MPTQSINMVVVTGGSGFLGAYVVCTLLQQGKTVKAIRRAQSNLKDFEWVAQYVLGDQVDLTSSKLSWLEADILDVMALEQAFEGAEIVYHCAADVSFNGNTQRLFKTNQEGTANVVNAALKLGVKKLAYVSSTAALGRTDSQQFINEETQWVDDHNNTLYAESKHLAELEVWRGVEEGLPAVIVNPGIILGPGFWHKGSSQLFQKIAKNWSYYTTGINGFVGVKDVARILIELAESDTVNQRYVLVSDNISYQTLFNEMAKGLGVKPPSVHIKAAWVPFIKWLLHLYKLINPQSSVSAETLATAVKQHQYDSNKILETGNYFMPIETVIAETCSAYKSKI